MKMNNVILVFTCVVLSALTSYGVLSLDYNDNVSTIGSTETVTTAPVQTVAYNNATAPTSFTRAASISTPTVVHVKTKYTQESNSAEEFYGDEMYQWFFGDQQMAPRQSAGSGSGVIVSSDGYIVTNNHVIDNASEIEISLSNNKSFTTTLVGRDRDTDLALLKIEADGLPFIEFGNSDEALIGEWVLAVGNPFDLSSTVTAGIVSAKGRNINILENVEGRTNTAIESFIQTDAAVNPGNSGGALVNTDGKLIGINTAIATPTGTFAGYSFAVPSNLVEKVVVDLKEYGAVQRGFIGVNIANVDNILAEELGLFETNGVYLQGVIEDGAADEAGLVKGDVIIAIDGEKMTSTSTLQEKIGGYRPGNIIEVSYIHQGNTYSTKLSLKNKYNNLDIITNDM